MSAIYIKRKFKKNLNSFFSTFSSYFSPVSAVSPYYQKQIKAQVESKGDESKLKVIITTFFSC